MKARHHISRHPRPSCNVLNIISEKPLKYVCVPAMTIVTTGFFYYHMHYPKGYILFSMVRIVTVNGYDHR